MTLRLGVEAQVTASLRAMNAAGGYPMSLVCTDRGLLIASAGEIVRSEVIAGLTSLFDDIAVRAARDLGLADIDELSLSDAASVTSSCVPWRATTTRDCSWSCRCRGTARGARTPTTPPAACCPSWARC
jgi:hypothetical protein